MSCRRGAVLALMATECQRGRRSDRRHRGTVEAVRSIAKLDLPESDTEHRRVLAVLRFLEAR
jgi:hypothetical protein